VETAWEEESTQIDSEEGGILRVCGSADGKGSQDFQKAGAVFKGKHCREKRVGAPQGSTGCAIAT
jgi:hypothetical protein